MAYVGEDVDRQILGTRNPQLIADRVRAIFTNAFQPRGLSIAEGSRSEQQRIDEAVADLMAGRRTFEQFRGSVTGIAEGRTPQAPYDPTKPLKPQTEAERLREETQRDNLAIFQQLFQDFDIPGAESLAQWAWGELVAGKSRNEIMLQLHQRPEFLDRFKVIAEQRQAGVTPMTPAEVLEWERSARGIMRAAGMPAGFYDSPDDFTEMMVNGWSVIELRQVVDEGFVRVAYNPEARDYMRDVLGVDGDAALAALYLDAEKALPQLERMTTQVEIGGVGSTFGLDLSLGRAGQLADAGVTRGAMRQGLMRLDGERSLFTETISEGTDLSIEQQGLDSTFGLGEGGAEVIEQRKRERKAAMSGAGGNALLTDRGLVGVGIADS